VRSRAHLTDVYRASVSKDTISAITDRVLARSSSGNHPIGLAARLLGDDRVDASAMTAGLWDERTSTHRFVRATFRRALVLERCGHASAVTAPTSIATCTEARAMIRFVVFAAICGPSTTRLSLDPPIGWV
jgi:hypothetical protein